MEFSAPEQAIGRTTVTAMQSGMIYGYAAMVDGLIARLAKEINQTPEDIFVVATGGLAPTVCQHCAYVNKVDQMLTLEGLRLIAERNKGGRHHA